MESLTWIGTIFGIIGVIATITAYKRSRATPRPAYQSLALRLVGADDPALPKEVDIRFKGDLVPRLSSAHIVFWNAGNVTIDGEKIVEGDPLRLEVNKEAQILRVVVLRSTREVIGFCVGVGDTPNKALLKFDYLDAGDGAVVEVLHTDKEMYPKVLGSIRGIPKGIEYRGKIFESSGKNSTRKRNFRRVFGGVVIFFGLMGLVLLIDELSVIFGKGILIGWLHRPPPKEEVVWPPLLAGGLYFIFGLIQLSMFWMRRRRFPSSLGIEEIKEGEEKRS